MSFYLAQCDLRFSNVKQAVGGSEDRQLELTDKYCEKENLELVERFHDLGKSAHKGGHRKKGRFGDFLNAVKAGTIPAGTILLVESFDRLSREQVTVALEHFLALINTYRLEIHVIQVGRVPAVYKAGSVDTNTLLMAIIEMGRAFGESERKGILVTAAWQEQRDRGKPIGKKRRKADGPQTQLVGVATGRLVAGNSRACRSGKADFRSFDQRPSWAL